MDIKLATWEAQNRKHKCSVWSECLINASESITRKSELAVILLKLMQFVLGYLGIFRKTQSCAFPPNAGWMNYCLSINTRPKMNIHKSEKLALVSNVYSSLITLSRAKPDRTCFKRITHQSPVKSRSKAG